jgi:hypothetical protein
VFGVFILIVKTLISKSIWCFGVEKKTPWKPEYNYIIYHFVVAASSKQAGNHHSYRCTLVLKTT